MWDFERQIPAIKPDLVIVNKKKKNLLYSELYHPRKQLKKGRKRKESAVLGRCQGTKKSVELENNCETNCNLFTWNVSQRLRKKTGRMRNWRMNGDHPYYSIVEVGQNTEKSPVDLRRLAIAQTQVKDHRLMLMWETTNNNNKLATSVQGGPNAPFSVGVEEDIAPFPGLFHITLDPYLTMLSVKQGGIVNHFLSLWYDATSDWTLVSKTIGEHYSLGHWPG